jgi:AcrR family transcriptional regulator
MDPDDRRRHLLNVARRVFADRGFHGASVSDLIGEAGVARGTFYNYFEGKRAIFQEVLEELAAELTAAALPIDIHAPIAPQVRENFARVIRAAMAPETSRLLFTDAVGIDDQADVALRAFYDDATLRIRTALEHGQRLSIVREANTQVLAEILVGMIKGPVLLAALRGDDLDADAVVDEVLALLAVGVLRMGPSVG